MPANIYSLGKNEEGVRMVRYIPIPGSDEGQRIIPHTEALDLVKVGDIWFNDKEGKRPKQLCSDGTWNRLDIVGNDVSLARC